MQSTRFDLAASMIENLRKYIDVNPEIRNPAPIIDRVCKASNELKDLEKDLKKYRDCPTKITTVGPMQSAIAGWKAKNQQFFKDGKKLTTFLKENEEEIEQQDKWLHNLMAETKKVFKEHEKEIKRQQSSVQQLKALVSKYEQIERRLERIESINEQIAI